MYFDVVSYVLYNMVYIMLYANANAQRSHLLNKVKVETTATVAHIAPNQKLPKYYSLSQLNK
jgi:hypothetical protein